MSRKSLLLAGVAGALVLSAAAGWLAWSNRTTPDAPPPAAIAVTGKDGQQVASYVVPEDRDILAEANAGQIIHGKRLLAETARLLPDNVGNGLNCNSCHLADGKVANANPYINTVNFYPRVMPRAAREVDLVGRINGCFQRSMNGRPLASESAEMEAMIAYMDWLRQGVEKENRVDMLNPGLLDESLVPDPVNGERIYAAQCAMCHGDAGEGMHDQFGDYIFPPLLEPFQPTTLEEPIVINLWESWCPPCRREMPMMADVAANTDDARLVFVNQGEGADIIRRFLKTENLELDHVVPDALGEFGRHYEVPGLPATFFIGRDGTLQSVHMDEISREGLTTGIRRIAEGETARH